MEKIKKYKWFIILPLCSVLMFTAAMLGMYIKSLPPPPPTTMECIQNSVDVRIESAAEPGKSTWVTAMWAVNLNDLTYRWNIEPTEEEFEGDWLYRFTYNPVNGLTPEAPFYREIVVLAGEECLSIDGTVYRAANGVSYDDILNWIALKYDYATTEYEWWEEPPIEPTEELQ